MQYINTMTVSPKLDTYNNNTEIKKALTEADFLGLEVFHKKVKWIERTSQSSVPSG